MDKKTHYSYGRQFIHEEDIQAVADVLRSDWLTQGPLIPQFEKALCEKLGSQYASVVCNGTAALHLAALALGWKGGDVVLTTPITFVASANCVLYAGATPDFVDIDPASYTIDINLLEAKIKKIRTTGNKIKAVVGVDFAGHPCDWESLRYLANKYEFRLINDYCHALGAKYKGEISYAVKYADVAILSFHPVKHITTGEGGAILTNDASIDRKIKMLRNHGITKDEQLLEKNEGPWYYEMHFLGFNYRITDFQCALGLSQLQRLDQYIQKRRAIANFYNDVFVNYERFIIPGVSNIVEHAYHLYPLQIKFDEISITKKEFFERMRKRKILCQVHYIPVHLQPYYRQYFQYKQGDFPLAEQFYEREVSMPLYPSLEQEDLDYISKSILDSLSH